MTKRISPASCVHFNGLMVKVTEKRSAWSHWIGHTLLCLLGLLTVQYAQASVTVTWINNNIGWRYLAPASVPLTVAVSDSNNSIARVEYYQGTTLIATSSVAPYSAAWSDIPPGSYSLSATVFSTSGESATTSRTRNFTVDASNILPSVNLTAPVVNASYSLPVTLKLEATASDPQTNTPVVRVDFYQGSTLIGTSTGTSSPHYYTANWTPTVAGSYSLTAKATDSVDGTSTSAPVTISIAPAAQATVYYLHTDHLNTPRLVTDEQNTVVWRSLPLAEPFGNTPPEEDPDGNGIPFSMNLRFPGQYADKETNTNYNYFRDYNPQTGSYIQSDPIGLQGGINTYGYVKGNPLKYTDPLGLVAGVDDAVVGGGVLIVGCAMSPGCRQGVSNAMSSAANAASAAYNKVKEWCSGDSSREECKKECVAQYERDAEECGVANAFWGKKGYQACMTRAGEYLGQCMKACDGK